MRKKKKTGLHCINRIVKTKAVPYQGGQAPLVDCCLFDSDAGVEL